MEVKPPVEADAPLSFDDVYATYVDQVARWVRLMGAPEAERNDLVQEVFVIVCRRLAHFEGPSLAGFIYRITQRKVRDWRRLRWFRSVMLGDGRGLDHVVDRGQLPHDQLATRERAEHLEHLLGKLNDSERAALLLFELDGAPGAKIAELQRVPLNTVWARIRSARLKLHRELARWESSSGKGKRP